jgi:hypothetical protein
VKLSERLGWVVAALIGGAVLGGSVIALLDIGATLGELRCRLAPDSPIPPDPGHERG